MMLRSVLTWCVASGLGLAATGAAARIEVDPKIAVDRAGNLLVMGYESPLSGLGQTYTAMVIDSAGRLTGCKNVDPTTRALARADAPGFLVDTSSAADRLVPQIERWDARGASEWTFELPRQNAPRGLLASADGGALLWLHRNPNRGEWDNQLVRLDSGGRLVRRTDIFPARFPSCSVSMHEDDFGRVQFATGGPCGPFGERIGSVGLINADGRPAWRFDEFTPNFARRWILRNGNGDFWRVVDAFNDLVTSRLELWTPWGLQLAEFEGPALVPGTEITQPQLDGGDVWFLATGVNRMELARAGRTGLQARYDLGTSIGFDILAARGGHAWVLTNGIGGARVGSELRLYSRNGPAWQRQFVGMSPLQVVADDRQSARVLLRGASDSWLMSLAARRGETQWQRSITEAFLDCKSRG
jgi:hypothetical protein